MYSNSCVCLPIHSWANTPDTPTTPRLNPPIHSYAFHKTFSESQIVRMYSNSYVCLPIHSYAHQKPIHSYVVQFIRMSSSKKKTEPQFIRMSSAFFVRLPKKKSFWTPIHSYVVQVFRMSSTSFVCLPQKSFWTPVQSYVVQVFRMSSKIKSWTLIHSYVFQFLSMS